MQTGKEHFLLLFLFFFLIRIGCQTAENLPRDQEDLEVPLHPLDPKDPEVEKKGERKKETSLKSCETFNQSAQSRSAVQRILTQSAGQTMGEPLSTNPEADGSLAIDTFVLRPGRQNGRREIIRRL